LPLCIFDPRCEVGGLDALEQYRREWDDTKKAFRASTVHDWTSHPADAFRYLSLAWRPAPLKPQQRRPASLMSQDGWIIPPPRESHRREMVL
jgi:phage terminase large subunit